MEGRTEAAGRPLAPEALTEVSPKRLGADCDCTLLCEAEGGLYEARRTVVGLVGLYIGPGGLYEVGLYIGLVGLYEGEVGA